MSRILLLTVFFVALGAASADEVFPSRPGREVRVNMPRSFQLQSLPSDGGQRDVVSCSFDIAIINTPERTFGPEKHTLRFAYDSISRQVWLGPVVEVMFSLGGKLYGVLSNGRELFIIPSTAVGEDLDGVDAVLRDALLSYCKEPRPLERAWTSKDILDSHFLLGKDALVRPLEVNRGGPEALKVIKAQIAADQVSLKILTLVSGEYIVQLTSDFQVTSVLQDGAPIFLMFDGRRRNSDLIEWSWPYATTIVTEDGTIPGVIASRTFYEKPPAPEDTHFSMKAVVEPKSQRVWLGPTECRLAKVRGELMGVQLVGRTVFLFRDAGRLPGEHPSQVEVGRLLRKFQADVDSNGSPKPTRTFAIPSLETDGNLAVECSLMGVEVRKGELLLNVRQGRVTVQHSLTLE